MKISLNDSGGHSLFPNILKGGKVSEVIQKESQQTKNDQRYGADHTADDGRGPVAEEGGQLCQLEKVRRHSSSEPH